MSFAKKIYRRFSQSFTQIFAEFSLCYFVKYFAKRWGYQQPITDRLRKSLTADLRRVLRRVSQSFLCFSSRNTLQNVGVISNRYPVEIIPEYAGIMPNGIGRSKRIF